MDGWFLAALILSITNIVICLAIFLMPKRQYAIIFRFAFDIVNISNSICLYMYVRDPVIFSIIAAGVVSAVRDVIFLFRGKYKWADSYWWLIFFTIALTVFSVLGWSGWLTLLPVIGTIINTYALYVKDYKYMKMITLVGQVCFIVYYVVLIPESDVLMALNLAVSSTMFISAIVGLGIYFYQKRYSQKAL